MSLIVNSVIVLGGVAIGASGLLLWASKKFKVEKDPRLNDVMEILPGVNCGACGYASCEAFGKAVLNKDAPTSGCVAGGQDVSEKLSGYFGVTCDSVCGVKARVACNGGENCKDKFNYNGINQCSAAILIQGGQKMCDQACLGFGDCKIACKFNAIKMIAGIPKIDWDLCTGCGACVDACPKKVIHVAPEDKLVHVMCQNNEPAVEVLKKCSVGCIACKICEKSCPKDAIHVKNKFAVVDYEKCINCGICVNKCPKKIIEKKAVQKK